MSASTTLNHTQPPLDDDTCYKDHRWPYFLFPSVIIYLFGIVCILVSRACIHLINRHKTKKVSHHWTYFSNTNRFSIFSKRMYNVFGKAVCGHSIKGKILLVCSAFFIVASIIIYLIDSTRVPPVENPMVISNEPIRVINLICHIFFLIYFIPKFMGSYNKLDFWLRLPTFADIFTIPPVFTELALGHQWIGMRFVCFFRILMFTEIFQSLSILKTATQIRLSELLSIFCCVWLSGAGFIHLVENSGSPTLCYKDTNPISYWNSFYLVLITMSTVGYGDRFCITIAGKIFIIFFIIIAVALFASFIPEIIEIVSSSREQYNIEYIQEFEVRHVIVGGSITFNSIKNFVEDFTHPDRSKNNFKSIIFDSTVPSPDILTTLRSMTSKMAFIKGSMNKVEDLNRIKFQDAEAFIILTNLSSSSPDEEDMSNIMKAIAAKKHSSNVKVILQLIKQENKPICINLPCWTEKDQIICLTEINNGFMAAGCLVPGFSTLITNLILLITKHSSKQYSEWQRSYMDGAEMEVYSGRFSKYFFEKPLDEVIGFCYKKFKLLMVGVSHAKDAQNISHPRVIINPDSKYFITSQTIGFFFCPSEEDTMGVKYYCSKCHSNQPFKNISRCSCPLLGIGGDIRAEPIGLNKVKVDDTEDLGHRNEGVELAMEVMKKPEIRDNLEKPEKIDNVEKTENLHGNTFANSLGDKGELISIAHKFKKKLVKQATIDDDRRMDSLDITGCYHWCVKRKLNDCILLNYNMSARVKNGNHIILYSQELSPGSLRCFVLPLRTSCLYVTQLRTIVILVNNIDELKSEWDSIDSFPLIFASVGSPMNRSVLRGLNISKCHMFVVMAGLSARMSLNDSQTILITLNTQSIVSIPAQNEESDVNALRLLVRSLTYSKSYCEKQVAILTEISDYKSIKYVELTKSDSYEIFYCTRPYACGRIFISRVFDTLTTTSFFFPETYKLVKVFITGTDSDEQELLQAEGISQFKEGVADSQDTTPRCTVHLLPLDSGILMPFKNANFEKLFLSAYTDFGIMCIGLYRLISLLDSEQMSQDRFVLTNPHPSLQLDTSDLVYSLCHQNLREDLLPTRNIPY